MARERDPNRDKAFEIWKKHDGNITNREIAHLLSTDEKKIAVWKQRDKWNVVQQKKNEKKNVVQQTKRQQKKARSPSKKNKEEPVTESDELTDKQRDFCMYYVKYRNKTKAYMKAYKCSWENANAHAYELWENVGVKEEIDGQLKELRDELKLDSQDILQKYIDIAFADITDFVEFGREEVTDDLGNPYEVNRVKFRESSEVDGTIITEVKQGKDGVSVKLADKMKALEFLSKHTDLLNENNRKKLQEEKIKMEIDKTKAEIEKLKGNGDSDDDLIDEWVEAVTDNEK